MNWNTIAYSMRNIKKEVRIRVWNKYGNHCAYCGIKLEYKQMQVDHIKAHWHNLDESECKKINVTKGADSEDNMNPSCARCNRWKSTLTIEKFRNEIEKIPFRLNRDNPSYRMAVDFLTIQETETPVVFFFEIWDYGNDN